MSSLGNLEQNTPEWEEMRKDKIGASDAPIIMGVSPWRTPYQLWQEKLSLIAPRQNYAMARGHQLEPKALELLEQKTGLLFHPVVKIHAELHWMIASLDAVDVEDKCIAEIKCPGEKDHSVAVNGSIPEKYFPQLQHQMEVAQVEFAYYFSFDGTDGVLLKVYRDDDYIKNLINTEKEFYECIQELSAPSLTERDYQTVDSPEWLNIASKWKHVTSQLSALEAEEKKLRESLISLSGNQNSKGGGIAVMKGMRKGSVDYKKIPELRSLNLDAYRKESISYWKITHA